MSSETQTLIILILAVSLIVLAWRFRVLAQKLNELRFQKKSADVTHGKSWEQFAPYMDDYPYDPERFRFIGTPIDGISFEDDKIVFVEFKTGKSALSATQRRVREQVQQGNVEWKEMRW